MNEIRLKIDPRNIEIIGDLIRDKKTKFEGRVSAVESNKIIMKNLEITTELEESYLMFYNNYRRIYQEMLKDSIIFQIEDEYIIKPFETLPLIELPKKSKAFEGYVCNSIPSRKGRTYLYTAHTPGQKKFSAVIFALKELDFDLSKILAMSFESAFEEALIIAKEMKILI